MGKKTLIDTYPWHLRLLGIAAVFLFLGITPLSAQKTDVVVLLNGDRITGEIKKLARGKLEYKTDDMGWIYIEWEKIAKISSKNRFDVEMDAGKKHIGTLQEASESGKMIILTDEGPIALDMLSVILITPLEALFKERFKGYLDVGFSFQKANQLTNWIFGTEVTYRYVKWEAKAEGSSYFSKQKDVEGTTRHSLTLQFSRLLKNRWRATLLTKLQQNEELGLELRTTLGGGAGRHLIQTNSVLLLLGGGVVVTKEKFVGAEETQYNAEALGRLSFQAFRFDNPKLDTILDLNVFPSLTDFGRLRIEFNGRIRYELFKDFFITLSVFDHFDSRPGIEDVSKNDYGVDVTLSYSFK